MNNYDIFDLQKRCMEFDLRIFSAAVREGNRTPRTSRLWKRFCAARARAIRTSSGLEPLAKAG
jgi:hypothetical protein